MFSLNKIRILIALFFTTAYLLIYFATSYKEKVEINLILDQQVKDLDNNYYMSRHVFEDLSNCLYSVVLNEELITELLYRAKHAKTDNERRLIRKALYKKMQPYFNQFAQSGLKIMLFSFEDNITFLRVHKPEKYDDNLSSVRYSFKYANENREQVRGFEQGKISHAFRNIFPIYRNNEYLGSVDFAFSSEAMQENMTLVHETDTHFILNKTLFEVNLYKAQNQVNYVQSIEHEDFLFALTPSQKNSKFNKEKLELNKYLKNQIAQNILHQGPFSLYHDFDDKAMIISFIPIKNIKEKKTVAYMVSYTDSVYLKNIINQQTYIKIIFFVILLILAYLILHISQERFNLQILVNKEVEKNKKQQDKLLIKSRMAQLGEMISMIAHQWRQPLSSISAISSTLSLDSMMDNYKKDFFIKRLNDIGELAQHLSTTIDDFRNFYEPDKRSVNVTLDSVMEKALNIINDSLAADKIEIIKVCDGDETIRVYENELMQVLLNILKNAQDNFKEKGTISPKIIITIKENIIDICDNGGGIPEDIMQRIFDPYFSTKSELNGTGLGLYMSKIIVEEHHAGNLVVKNQNDGVCFIIELNLPA